MSDLVSVFSGENPNKSMTNNHLLIPPLLLEKSKDQLMPRLDRLDRLIDEKLKDKLNAEFSLRDQVFGREKDHNNLEDSLDHGDIPNEDGCDKDTLKRLEDARDRFNELVKTWNGRI
jgi:hypothetical protein